MNLSFDTYAHLASIKNAKLRTLVTEEQCGRIGLWKRQKRRLEKWKFYRIGLIRVTLKVVRQANPVNELPCFGRAFSRLLAC